MQPPTKDTLAAQLERLDRGRLEELAVQAAKNHAAFCELSSREGPAVSGKEHLGEDEIRERVRAMDSRALAQALAGPAWLNEVLHARGAV